MTDDRIRELAAKHAAYADSTLTLRGDAVVAFARELIDANDATWLKMIEENRQSAAVAGAWYARQCHEVDCD